ncbi:outer membrane lipoprotein LolB [Oleiagrimonas sp. C23AA]|nr:outer membrane lipoprotein LolB [Oleiagrimonas sp. C23AA]
MACLVLAACAPVPVPVKKLAGNADTRATQRARVAALAGRDHWTIEGRLGVSDGHHGGSGSLTWTQNGERYDFTLRAPVTGRSFRLHGGPQGAELDGLDGGPRYGRNAQQLMARALGWQVPMAQLRAWVLGLRARQVRPAKLAFGINGLPSQIVQGGWTVQYPAWFTDRQPALPKKVFAARPPYKVRLSIESWTFH